MERVGVSVLGKTMLIAISGYCSHLVMIVGIASSAPALVSLPLAEPEQVIRSAGYGPWPGPEPNLSDLHAPRMGAGRWPKTLKGRCLLPSGGADPTGISGDRLPQSIDVVA